MAYITGLLTLEEADELLLRGWVFEEPPNGLQLTKEEAKLYGKEGVIFKSVWVDNSMFNIMSGPGWDKRQ